jgi:DNA-directed RNA polymerase subunit L
MENISLTNSGYTLTADIKSVPVGFVNGLRRILTAEIPAVVLTNIEIVDNTTSMTHEMLRHRVEQIPVAVQPTETGVIRDTKVELRIVKAEKEVEITTDDFVVTAPRKDVLLKDRDLETSGVFLNLTPGQSLHIRAVLGLESRGIAQCVASYKNHIDPEQAKLDKDTWILEGNDPREFDNFHIQRSYSRDANGRPNWFDFTVDSIGITKASDLIKKACEIYKTKIEEFATVPVQRYDQGRYRVIVPGETYTLGTLVQTILYDSGLVDWARMTIGHPLLPELVVEFDTKIAPEKVIARVKEEALALCENVLKSV